METGKTSVPAKSSKPPSSPPEPSVAPKTTAFPDLLNSSQTSSDAEPGGTAVSVLAENLDPGMNSGDSSLGSEDMEEQAKPPQSTVVQSSTPTVNPQDDRELKRQRRKQSNRESARRSRLKKQAECEELQQTVDALTNENCILQDELRSLWKECEKLESENTFLKVKLNQIPPFSSVVLHSLMALRMKQEELTRICPREAVSDSDNSRSPSPANESN